MAQRNLSNDDNAVEISKMYDFKAGLQNHRDSLPA